MEYCNDWPFSGMIPEAKRPNILVVGNSGSGKSSLIHAVLGDGENMKNDAINESMGQDFYCFENAAIRLWDSRGLRLGESESVFRRRMTEFIDDCRIDPDVCKHIHLLWYLIPGSGARVTECDLRLMQSILSRDQVIAVISKSDITRPAQAAAIRKTLREAGIPDERIVETSDFQGGSIGCRELIAQSCRMLPEAIRDAFIAALKMTREMRLQKVAGKKHKAEIIIAAAVTQAEELARKSCPKDRKPFHALMFFAEKSLDRGVRILLNSLITQLAALYHIDHAEFQKDAAQFIDSIAAELPSFFSSSELESGAFVGAEVAGYLTEILGKYFQRCFETVMIARVREEPAPGFGFDVEQFRQFFLIRKKEAAVKPNILVCGRSGVGKTSLIQAVTHCGVVPDSAIGDGGSVTKGFQVYRTEIADFIDSEGMIPGEQSIDEYTDFILNEMFKRVSSGDRTRLIHNIWYCIDGSGAQLEEADIQFFKTFRDHVILVVTKSELMRKEQLESLMKALLAVIDRNRIAVVSAENKTGLTQLIAKAQLISTRALSGVENEAEEFQRRWNEYYRAMRIDWFDSAGHDADDYIYWAAGRAAAIALIPLPLADVGPLIANEVYMIYKLAGVYGIAADNAVTTMLLGSAGGSIAGKVGASFLPFLKVPIAAAVTYGVGKAAKAYFESDMTLTEEQLKAVFLAGERAAKKYDWKSEAESCKVK